MADIFVRFALWRQRHWTAVAARAAAKAERWKSFVKLKLGDGQ